MSPRRDDIIGAVLTRTSFALVAMTNLLMRDRRRLLRDNERIAETA
jgi:hypothetical protein